MLLNTTGYEYRDPQTGETRHIDTTIDTRDLHWGKYNCGMAVYLESLLLDGDTGDDWDGTSDVGHHVTRYGRWILENDSQGFIFAWKAETEAEAEAVMERVHEMYRDDEEGEAD